MTVITGLYPAITDVGHKRSFDWDLYGCARPVEFFETLLKESIDLGKSDFILIDKHIDIFDEDGSLLICLDDNDTKPLGEKILDVTDHGQAHYRIELKKPSPRNDSSLDTPAFDESGLGVYKYFKKGSGFGYHPHKYPTPAMRHLNPFVNPYLTSDSRFSRQVGMQSQEFWKLVDRLKASGLKKRRNLPVEAMVALYRTKLRQDIDFSLLSTMYGSIGEWVGLLYF